MLNAMFKECADKPTDAATGRVSFKLGDCYSSFCGRKPLENAHDALADSVGLLEVLNASAVCSKLTLAKLFSYLVPKKKALNEIKKAVGVRYQTKADIARTAVVPEYKDSDASNLPVELKSVPIYEADSGDPMRLCINCMTFTAHKQCNLKTSSLQSRQELDVEAVYEPLFDGEPDDSGDDDPDIADD